MATDNAVFLRAAGFFDDNRLKPEDLKTAESRAARARRTIFIDAGPAHRIAMKLTPFKNT